MLWILCIIISVLVYYFISEEEGLTRIFGTAAFVILALAFFNLGIYFVTHDFSKPQIEKTHELISIDHDSASGSFVFSSCTDQEVYNIYIKEGDGYKLKTIPAKDTMVFEKSELTTGELVVYDCQQPWFVDLLTLVFFDYPNAETRYELYIPSGSLSREIQLNP
ncbi:MAG: hypothetical protein J6J60_10350 [Clostridia bacterium]|nr:hypothetical protein [Clostridia bacterium]